MNYGAIRRNKNIIALAYDTSIIKLYNIKSKKCVGILAGHDKSVICIDISPSDQELASGCEDGSLKFWDLKNLKWNYHYNYGKGEILNLKYSLDSNFIAIGSKNKISLLEPKRKIILKSYTFIG